MCITVPVAMLVYAQNDIDLYIIFQKSMDHLIILHTCLFRSVAVALVRAHAHCTDSMVVEHESISVICLALDSTIHRDKCG